MRASELRRRAKLPKSNLGLIGRARTIQLRYHVPFGLAHLLVDWPRRVYSANCRLRQEGARLRHLAWAERRFLLPTLATLCTPLTLVLLHTCGGS